MKDIHVPKTYEQELIYMPYKESLKKTIEIICSEAPVNGTLLDLMCGPGYLLAKISEKRRDLSLLGVDIDKRYIEYAKRKYPGIAFEVGDVLEWKPEKTLDVVICTGSLHHIPYEKQQQVMEIISSMVRPKGVVIISDCHIDDYSNENERKVAAARLGYEYLIETIKNGAPKPVIEAAIDILCNDVTMKEFKTSLKKRIPTFEMIFRKVEVLKTWPELESEYGDYIVVCKSRKE